MEDGYFKGLFSGISSITRAAVLSSVDLYLHQCIRDSLGAGGSTVVPLYIHCVEPRLFFPPSPGDAMVSPLSVHPSSPLFKPPFQPASCLFSCSCIWARGRQQNKDFISYTNNSSILLNHYLPKKKHVTVPHQEVSSALHKEWGEILSLQSL